MRVWALALLVSLLAPAPARSAEPRARPEAAPAQLHFPELAALTREQKEEALRQIRIEEARRCAARKDILGWGRALFPEKFPLDFCPGMHQYFVDIRGLDFTNTEAPRGHAKTTIKCFLIPLFQALEEPGTFNFYLNIQASDEKALDINRSIKLELEQNRELRDLYGDQIGERWTDAQFVLKNGVLFVGKGIGKSLKGINYRNRRPDYVLVDDLYDEDDLNNPESTTKKNDWFWGTLYKATAIGRRVSLHVQGTAVNNHDLLHLLKKNKTVSSRTFQAVTSWEAGTVLWPSLNDTKRGALSPFQWMQQEQASMSSLIFAREMQNERWDEASAIVKRSWLVPESGKTWDYDPIVEKFDRKQLVTAVVLGVDPSVGRNQENDYTGIALVYRTQWEDARPPEFWIEGLWNEHLTANRRVLKLQEIADAQDAVPDRSVTAAHIEDNAGFQDFVDEVKRRTSLLVRGIKQNKDKITVLMNKAGVFERGQVHLSTRISPEMRDLILTQLTTNYPAHDDLRDALLLAIDDKTGLWRHVS